MSRETEISTIRHCAATLYQLARIARARGDYKEYCRLIKRASDHFQAARNLREPLWADPEYEDAA